MAFRVGDRSKASAIKSWQQIPNEYIHRFSFADHWETYHRMFDVAHHQMVDKAQCQRIANMLPTCYVDMILMAWSNKEQATPFETFTIPGLTYLHGQVMDKKYHQDRYAGQSYPLLRFPSGLMREVFENPISHQPFVNIWGGLHLPYFATLDEAYEFASNFAEMYQLQILAGQDNWLTILNKEGNRAYHLEFDNDHRRLTNIVLRPTYAMELLDGESRAVLPPLYANEKWGLKAVAPVKFFTPDSGWTWYATEYDGTDIFFGLVSGFEVELGYFSMSDLESIRGPLGLFVERDLFFQPTDLETIQTWHRS